MKGHWVLWYLGLRVFRRGYHKGSRAYRVEGLQFRILGWLVGLGFRV